MAVAVVTLMCGAVWAGGKRDEPRAHQKVGDMGTRQSRSVTQERFRPSSPTVKFKLPKPTPSGGMKQKEAHAPDYRIRPGWRDQQAPPARRVVTPVPPAERRPTVKLPPPAARLPIAQQRPLPVNPALSRRANEPAKRPEPPRAHFVRFDHRDDGDGCHPRHDEEWHHYDHWFPSFARFWWIYSVTHLYARPPFVVTQFQFGNDFLVRRYSYSYAPYPCPYPCACACHGGFIRSWCGYCGSWCGAGGWRFMYQEDGFGWW